MPIPPEPEFQTSMVRPWLRGLAIVQLPLIPLIGTGTAFGCTVVLNLAN